MKILAITAYDKWDPLAVAVLEGLNKHGVKLYCTYPGNGAINIISDEEFVTHYPTTDYILAFFTKMETPPPKYYLIDTVGGWDKTAYIDGSEWNYTGYRYRTDEQLHPLFKDKAHWYFRRECLPEHIEQGVIPLPLGAVDADFGNYEGEKDIEVLCAFGQVDTGLRRVAVQACDELQAEGVKVVFAQKRTFADYLELISRSWITIEAHGGGECNARMWHIMANKSALFAQEYNIVMPRLERGWHYVGWSDSEELKREVGWWLEKKEALRGLIDASFVNLCLHHTSARRAQYLLRRLNTG